MSDMQATNPLQILILTLDELRYALNLSAVERVVQAVEITRLPKTPEFILGVINVQGHIIPVVDIRRRLRLPPRDLNLNDRFILACTVRRRMALVVDAVTGVRELADRDWQTAEQILPGMEYIHGLVKLEGDLVLIYDLDQFLSIDEEQLLDAALVENVPNIGETA
jgi:purine-binding chemotaxis protein CheW